MLSDEQMSKRWPFSLLNDEQMSNWVGVKHLPGGCFIFIIYVVYNFLYIYNIIYIYIIYTLGGVFKYVLCSSLFGVS